MIVNVVLPNAESLRAQNEVDAKSCVCNSEATQIFSA
jgi:hypothetical protein